MQGFIYQRQLSFGIWIMTTYKCTHKIADGKTYCLAIRVADSTAQKTAKCLNNTTHC